MSVDLKIHQAKDLKREENIDYYKNLSEKEKKILKQKKMLEQKYRLDIIDAFGANTSDDLGFPVNFITHNDYIIYNVGKHILIKEYPFKEEDVITKQATSFFIYLSPYVKEITSTSVSYDKNNFALCQEIEEDNKIYLYNDKTSELEYLTNYD